MSLYSCLVILSELFCGISQDQTGLTQLGGLQKFEGFSRVPHPGVRGSQTVVQFGPGLASQTVCLGSVELKNWISALTEHT